MSKKRRSSVATTASMRCRGSRSTAHMRAPSRARQQRAVAGQDAHDRRALLVAQRHRVREHHRVVNQHAADDEREPRASHGRDHQSDAVSPGDPTQPWLRRFRLLSWLGGRRRCGRLRRRGKEIGEWREGRRGLGTRRRRDLRHRQRRLDGTRIILLVAEEPHRSRKCPRPRPGTRSSEAANDHHGRAFVPHAPRDPRLCHDRDVATHVPKLDITAAPPNAGLTNAANGQSAAYYTCQTQRHFGRGVNDEQRAIKNFSRASVAND